MRNDADLRLAASRNSSIYRRLRLSQARAFAALFVYLGYPRMLHGVLKILRSAPIFRTLTGFSLAYRKTFRSFEEAQRTACRYIEAGHEHEDDVRIHAALSLRIRESDYPVFYHWARMSPSPSRVFDLGGNIGNLFYAYQNYMKFPEGMRWTIYDIPPIRAAGQLIANHRNESRILFVDSMEPAADCDLLLASGCLHYFEQPLHSLLGSLPKLPRNVIANRMPVSEGPGIVTVQDNKTYLVPCKIHNRSDFVKGMEGIGYRLVEFWPVHELALHVPLYPESSSRTYSGFYFSLD